MCVTCWHHVRLSGDSDHPCVPVTGNQSRPMDLHLSRPWNNMCCAQGAQQVLPQGTGLSAKTAHVSWLGDCGSPGISSPMDGEHHRAGPWVPHLPGSLPCFLGECRRERLWGPFLLGVSRGPGRAVTSGRWAPQGPRKAGVPGRSAADPNHCGCQALLPWGHGVGVSTGRRSGVKAAGTQAPSPKLGTTFLVGHQGALAPGWSRVKDLRTLLEFPLRSERGMQLCPSSEARLHLSRK